MSIIPALQWRYATKKMNGEVVVDAKIDAILEAIRLAPTSSGLQPFEVLVISNQKIKDQIRKVAFNQSQVSECSHLLVFVAWDHYTVDRITHYFDHYEKERDLPKGFSDDYKNNVTKQLTAMTLERQFEHAARQVYIALGFALAEAAVQGVDSVPMEGFVSFEVDQILGLDSKGLRSVLLLPLGYRDAENDWQAELKKVRKTKDHLFTILK